ncbi:hypothetical protein [Kitasatospora sp. NBC_01539]|uniref:hypothetical protein n=1 Tax=Kitasatospora sp. NBC_01539 TaxID=2903577 RepID=UPI00386016C6
MNRPPAPHTRPGSPPRRAAGVLRAAWRRGRQIELLHRSMAFAALCFVTVVPLLVVVAAASPTRGAGIADRIIDGLGLSGASARAVDELFVSRREVLSTTTALSLAAPAVFGVPFLGAVQNAYERIWLRTPGTWHAAWRQVVGPAAFVANAFSYGVIGTVLVVQSWLLGVGFCVYGGALAGHALHGAARVPRRRGPR